MDSRQVMYELTTSNSNLINGIVSKLYNSKEEVVKATKKVNKALNTFFLECNGLEGKLPREWTKKLTTKSLFEYYSMQNSLISKFFALPVADRKIIVSESANYINDTDYKNYVDSEYGFNAEYLIEKNDLLLKKYIFSSEIIKPMNALEKLKLTDESKINTLCSLAEKYYLQYLYYSERISNKSPVTFEKFLEIINLGKYSSKVKETLENKRLEELRELVITDDDMIEDIERINEEKINKELQEIEKNAENNFDDKGINNFEEKEIQPELF